jgi:predicted AlkP superfamily phosphohydrolase/phosphomutase
MTRVVAIGLDAVERSLVERLLDDGELPHLRALRDRSAVARLTTDRPYRSEYPWTEFVTGRSASALRYWSTLTFDPNEYHCDIVGAAPADPFYALGSTRHVIALDVPHSRLSSGVQGAQVFGWGAHDPQFPRCSRPGSLLGELERTHGEHPGIPIEYAGSWHQPEFLDTFAEALIDGIERRVGVVRTLVAQVPDWDLLVLTMGEAHTAGHQMWHGIDPRSPLRDAPTAPVAAKHLRAIHHALDRSIGEIVSCAPPDAAVVVFSVKGMEAADADLVSTTIAPELFFRIAFGRALLRTPDRWVGGPAVVPDPSLRPGRVTRLNFADGRREQFARYVRARHPAAIEWVRRLRDQRRSVAPPDQTPRPIADGDRDDLQPALDSVDSWHGACWYQRHWPRMRAFVIPSFSDLHVRINAEGRERSGLVPRADYASECARVEQVLRDCSDPRTGRPVFGTITRMRADDPMAPDGPGADLVVECNGPTDSLTHPDAGTIGPFPFARVGSHTNDGFAWFSGPGVEPRSLGTRCVIDLPPTILDLLGEARPHLEGRSLLPAPRRKPAPGSRL